jgi:uncharacterized protein
MFEYDPVKSAANAKKHGIDFETAPLLWHDDNRVDARIGLYGDEERRIIVGKIGDKHWTAVITDRGNRIRIISVRRARIDERKGYDGGGI